MKILFLLGSQRKHGNTDQFTGMIGSELQTLAAQNSVELELETLSLGDLDIRPCRGCRVCFDHDEQKCPLKDDLAAINAKMRAADGFLIASPIYVDDVSGTVKTWIDRLAFYCHRPGLAGKCAAMVVTVGSSPTGHALRTLSTALSTWGCHLSGQTGIFAGALCTPEEMETKFRKPAAEAAAKLFRAIYRQEFRRPSLRSLVTFRVQQLVWRREGPGTIDYAYWKERGWLERGVDFYFPQRTPWIKMALSNLAAAVIYRMLG